MLNWDDPLQEKPKTETSTEQKNVPVVQHLIDELDDDQRGMVPVRAEDKRVVNGLADVNQLAPFKYPWAWKYFLNANKNQVLRRLM